MGAQDAAMTTARVVAPSPAARRAALGLAKPMARPPYIPALDGLRAISVLAVVAYHLGRLQGGFLGVDVFFAISGFLITRLLLAEREREGRIALGSFWIRRFKRLVPALLVVIVAVAIGSKLWLPAWRLGDIRADALGAMAYVANWRFILSGQSYFATGVVPSPLRHTWSLAIEEQFYLLWPLVVVGAAALWRRHVRRAVGIVALVGVVGSAAWMATAAGQGFDLSRLYYGTDSRVFTLFAGAWLGTWWDPRVATVADAATRSRRLRRWSVAGAVSLVPVVVFFVIGDTADAVFYQGGFQVVAVFATVLVAGVASGVGPLCQGLGWAPFVWLGRRSYGIYLWSWPTQVFASEHFGLEGWVLDATVVAASVSLAALSFWLVEEPIRTGQPPVGVGRRQGEARRSRVPRAAWSCMAVLAVVGIVVGTSVGAPQAPDYTTVSDEEALSAATDDISDAEAEALLESASTTVPIDEGPPGPFTGAPDLRVDPLAAVDPTTIHGRPLNVLVTGDSVGWSLGWMLGDDLTPAVKVQDRAIIGCGLMPRDSSFIVGDRPPELYSDRCEKALLAEMKGLSQTPDVVLLWIGAWEVYDHEYQGEQYRVGTERYAEFLEEQIQTRVDRARGIGAATVIPIVPCFGPNAARLGNERLQQERIDWVNEVLRVVATKNTGWVRLIDPQDQLCDAEGNAKPTTPEGLPLRADGAHFDGPEATWFWNSWLAGQLGAAFADARAAQATTTTVPPPTTTTAPPG